MKIDLKVEVHIPPDVAKTIRHLSPALKSKVRAAIDLISNDPTIGKPLKDKLTGLYSFRVSWYRIIYRFFREKLQIQLVDIGKRSDIYIKVLERRKIN